MWNINRISDGFYYQLKALEKKLKSIVLESFFVKIFIQIRNSTMHSRSELWTICNNIHCEMF